MSALAGLMNIAGCFGPCKIRSLFALLFSARQQIFEGRRTGAYQATSFAEKCFAAEAKLRPNSMSSRMLRVPAISISVAPSSETPIRSLPPAWKLASLKLFGRLS